MTWVTIDSTMLVAERVVALQQDGDITKIILQDGVRVRVIADIDAVRFAINKALSKEQ